MGERMNPRSDTLELAVGVEHQPRLIVSTVTGPVSPTGSWCVLGSFFRGTNYPAIVIEPVEKTTAVKAGEGEPVESSAGKIP